MSSGNASNTLPVRVLHHQGVKRLATPSEYREPSARAGAP